MHVKKLAACLIVLATLAALAFFGRYWIFVYGAGLVVDTATLSPAGAAEPGVRWYDDYYTVEAIDEHTFAIGEPRYFQKNYNYLIIGEQRAVLFDAGPGRRDIRPVVQSLTRLPVTFIPSHFHYDHVGNNITFDHVAVLDLPQLRKRAPDGRLALTFNEHLGAFERIEAPTLKVDEWLSPNSRIDLGGRELTVLYTPGHTENSISLLDTKSGYVFAGDFVGAGALWAFLPTSNMADYLQGADTVLHAAPPASRVFSAHPEILDKATAELRAPELTLADVTDLRNALLAIRSGTLAGSGFCPTIYPVNSRIELYANPSWLQDWTPRHPE